MSEISNNLECSHFFGGKPGPTVRILLYTDDPVRVQVDVIKNWSLGVMLRHIEAHAPAFANLCFKFVSRNSTTSVHADQRLNDLLQNGDFDQVWFFGIHQGNRDNQTGVFLAGGPRSELEQDEVDALDRWMTIGQEVGQRGGGALMTGDHAELLPDNAVLTGPAPATGLWGIGRALGEKVPRAGKMRDWDGPPRTGETSRNTHFANADFNNPSFQFDDLPQKLRLELFEHDQPHPLFFYQQGTFIEVFPDHMHEGTIRIPTDNEFDDSENEWPLSVRPQVVARGTDHSKRGTEVDLVAAYDGDSAGVGRIVADSSWHHYVNINLNRFIPPTVPNSPGDQIGQFYANVAIWLTPVGKRHEMANAMIEWLATPESPLAETVLAYLNTTTVIPDEELSEFGQRAYEVLAQVASRCELHELCKVLPQHHGNAMELLGFSIKQRHEQVVHAETVSPSEFELITT